jgi:hypothetical protein
MAKRKRGFVLCVKAGRYEASLEPRNVYRVVPDPVAEARSLLRVVDETGEDYLFPASLVVPIEVPERAAQAFSGGAFVSRPCRQLTAIRSLSSTPSSRRSSTARSGGSCRPSRHPGRRDEQCRHGPPGGQPRPQSR